MCKAPRKNTRVCINVYIHDGVKMPFVLILEINLVENVYGTILSIVYKNELNMK